MPKPTFYCFRVRTTGGVAVARLNGIPIVEADRGGLSTTRAINEWLRPAGNELEVGFSWPADEVDAGRTLLRFELFRADPTQETPVPAEVLARVEWPLPEPEPPEGTEPPPPQAKQL